MKSSSRSRHYNTVSAAVLVLGTCVVLSVLRFANILHTEADRTVGRRNTDRKAVRLYGDEGASPGQQMTHRRPWISPGGHTNDGLFGYVLCTLQFCRHLRHIIGEVSATTYVGRRRVTLN